MIVDVRDLDTPGKNGVSIQFRKKHQVDSVGHGEESEWLPIRLRLENGMKRVKVFIV